MSARSRIKSAGCAQIFRVFACSTVVACLALTAHAQPPEPDQQTRPGQFVQRGNNSQTPASSVDFETKEPFSATYVGADIPTVVNQLFGEFLKIDYTIAPDVSGLLTMRLDNVKSRLATIEAVRLALRPMGIAVIDRGDMVAIARAADQGAPVQAGVIDPGQPSPPGGGVVVLTPRFITSSQLGPLVAPFAPSANIAATDDARRFLLVKGDEASISAISSAAAMFDVDWFAQVSVATFDLRNVGPDELMRELRPVLGPSASGADLIPVPRLSKLVVLARNPQLVPVIKGWVERLDVPSASLSPGVLVYRARNANAETLAQSLREGGSSGGGAATDAGTEPQPALSTPGPVRSIMVPNGLTGPGASQTQSLSVSWNLSQNAVIVRGDAAQLAEAKGLLEALDQPSPQVLIEAAIIEVTLDNELQYGLNWRGIEKKFTGTFTDAPNGQVTTNFPGFALTYVNTDIEAALNVLASITKVEVISRPSLVALNNESAFLQVGDQVPIVTQTAISVNDPNAPIVNQTTYRDTGVILTVTPRVRAGGMVELEVAQEVSQVARTTSSGIDSPTIQQRKIESKLLVPSGQSVALGGLISTNQTGSVTGIPILMDIPLLGQLFRSDGRLVKRTELVVFVTPRVLIDGAASVEATDQLRAAFRKLEEELGRR
jgi:general secretion pathway protein D